MIISFKSGHVLTETEAKFLSEYFGHARCTCKRGEVEVTGEKNIQLSVTDAGEIEIQSVTGGL